LQVEAETIAKSCSDLFKKDHVERDEVGREGGREKKRGKAKATEKMIWEDSGGKEKRR